MPAEIDLTDARETYETMMSDACVVYRNLGGRDNDFYDEETGGLGTPDAQLTPIYDQSTVGLDGRSLGHETAPGGKCIVFQAPEVALRPIDPQSNEIPRRYRGTIPWDAPAVVINDVWQMVYAENDKKLATMKLIVRDTVHATFTVSQLAILEEFTSARN
jgi:hypothetical protein